MGKHSLVIALLCIIAFSPLSAVAAENPVGKTGAKADVITEAYVTEWESGKMVLKKTDNLDRFMSMYPYEVADGSPAMEAYITEWESGKMVLKKTMSFNMFMSMYPYEVADGSPAMEAYVAERESGKIVLKKTDNFNAFMSMPPYEVTEEAYIIDRDSVTMKPTLRSDNIERLMSMPPYEASTDPASYSHPANLRADVAQAADPEASPVSQQCDWCYDQKS